MFVVLAVALALTSPVPVPRPAPGPSADAAAILAPAEAPARAVPGEGEVPVPVRRPGADYPATGRAAAETESPPHSGEPAASTRRKTAEVDGGGEGPPAGAAAAEIAAAPPVPIPPARPAPAGAAPAAEEDGEASSGQGGHDDGHGPPAADAPRPVARPGPASPEGVPVIKAMLVPDPALPPGSRPVAPRDMVCRDPRIVGAPAASFVGNISGCGIFEPVRVASISGIRMSAPITVDCRTARAFADWLTGVARPAAREALNSDIESLWIMGSYSCRTRNNQPGKRLSEHSAGRAIDIGGVALANGKRIVVRDDWNEGAAGDFLRRVWKDACGRFTTVLGPDGDRHHHDHLHLDTAYRSSTYCR